MVTQSQLAATYPSEARGAGAAHVGAVLGDVLGCRRPDAVLHEVPEKTQRQPGRGGDVVRHGAGHGIDEAYEREWPGDVMAGVVVVVMMKAHDGSPTSY